MRVAYVLRKLISAADDYESNYQRKTLSLLAYTYLIHELTEDKYCFTGRSWTRISGRLVHISVGSQVWGINRQQYIYMYLGRNRWKLMPGRLTNVSLIIYLM
jgi:hypothetical protein